MTADDVAFLIWGILFLSLVSALAAPAAKPNKSSG